MAKRPLRLTFSCSILVAFITGCHALPPISPDASLLTMKQGSVRAESQPGKERQVSSVQDSPIDFQFGFLAEEVIATASSDPEESAFAIAVGSKALAEGMILDKTSGIFSLWINGAKAYASTDGASTESVKIGGSMFKQGYNRFRVVADPNAASVPNSNQYGVQSFYNGKYCNMPGEHSGYSKYIGPSIWYGSYRPPSWYRFVEYPPCEIDVTKIASLSLSKSTVQPLLNHELSYSSYKDAVISATAYVTEGSKPAVGVPVIFESRRETATGGHSHDSATSPGPTGDFSNSSSNESFPVVDPSEAYTGHTSATLTATTDATGKATVYYRPYGFSGQERISARLQTDLLATSQILNIAYPDLVRFNPGNIAN